MKYYKHFAEDSGGAGGAGAVGAASGGAIATTTTAGIKSSTENPPMGKKAQKKYVANAMEEQADDEQQQKAKETTDADKKRIGRYRSGVESKKVHGLRQRTLLLNPRNAVPAVQTPSSGVSNRPGPQNPRKITGATYMETFAEFHKKTTKIKTLGQTAPASTFMTKEDTVRNQIELVKSNAKTHKNPTGFVSNDTIEAPKPAPKIEKDLTRFNRRSKD